MKNGFMFSALQKYKDQSYHGRFPSMMLDTPGGNLRIDLFAGVVVNGDRRSAPSGWKSVLDFTGYVDFLKRASTFRSGIAVKHGDRMITLRMCSYRLNDARHAAYGKPAPVK